MDPWSKGDYSWHILKAIMVMEELPEVNPPFGRVPGQELLLILIPKSRRRWNSLVFRVTEFSLGFFWTRGKYRTKGDLGGGPL